jgi:sporulation protein YlmC with PRC-barrel domain
VREQGQQLEQHAEQIHQHAEQLERQLAGMQPDPGAQQQQAEQDAEQPDEEQPADDELAPQAAEMRERAEQLWQLTEQFNKELGDEPRPEEVSQAVDHLEQEAVQLYEQVQGLRQQAQEMREVEVTEPADPEVEERRVAEACLQQLREFSRRAQQEGYWLTGWREGWGQPGMAPVAPGDPAMAPAQPGAPGAVPGEDPAAQPEVAEDPAMQEEMAQQQVFARDPRQETRVLYSAAHVFAQQGNEDGCMYVLSELEAHFEDHLAQMEEAGVDPGEVQTWRQDTLVGAMPVEEAFPTVRMESIIDSDVRNAQDEYLGYIDDAILDPDTGEIAYVIISHGGFLGFGEDSVAVPWEMLQYSPQMQTFVLNVPEEAIENAPSVDAEEFAQREVFEQRREEIHGYWQEQQPGNDQAQ